MSVIKKIAHIWIQIIKLCTLPEIQSKNNSLKKPRNYKYFVQFLNWKNRINSTSWYIPFLSTETCILLCLSCTMKTATELYQWQNVHDFSEHIIEHKELNVATVIDNTIFWDLFNGEQGWKEKTKGKFSVKLEWPGKFDLWH